MRKTRFNNAEDYRLVWKLMYNESINHFNHCVQVFKILFLSAVKHNITFALTIFLIIIFKFYKYLIYN